jgi:UDP-N-acetylmuramoyl-L-alanyl-D-glutamate--2,6-diaminopimelate ligase
VTLLELYEATGQLGQLSCPSNSEVKGLSRHSDKLLEGDIFFCRAGQNFDSHQEAQTLAKAGAAVIVGHQELTIEGNYWQVEKGEEAKIAAAFYGFPSRRLKVIGITGTDGKSSTAWILTQLLASRGLKTACLGTLGIWQGQSWQPWGFTTPEAEVLQKTFADLLVAGHSHVVMEVSSHALSSSRVGGTQFASVGLTNLGHDHLDDYPSLEAYHAAKEILFEMQKNPQAQVRPAHHPGVAAFRAGDNLKVSLIEEGRSCQKIKLQVNEKIWLGDFPLGGRHNLENLETALGLALALGLNFLELVEGIPSLKALAGRWQWVENTGQKVMVDYAHTPGALKTLLSNLRPLVKGQLKVIFGCGGNRDRQKRFLMGHEARQLADKIYVTDDNPRNEDPQSIRAEILKGLNGHGVDIADRYEAIEQAISELGDEDVLVIAGKGHEEGQLTGGVLKEFNDVDVARELWSKCHEGQ